MKPSEATSFPSQLFYSMDVLHKHSDTQFTTSQDHKCSPKRTVRRTLRSNSEQCLLVDRPLAQMTESARITNLPLIKVLLRTFGTFKVILVALHIVTAGENGICNAVSVDIIELAPNQSQTSWRTGLNQMNFRRWFSHKWKKTITKWCTSKWMIFSTMQVQTCCPQRKYVFRWYGYQPDKDTVEKAVHNRRRIATSYQNRANRQKVGKWRNYD